MSREKDGDANLPIAEVVPIRPVAAAAAAAPAAPAVSQQSFSRNAASGPRSKTPDPEEVERKWREWELKKQREKVAKEKYWEERKERERDRERDRERQRNAAEPGKSAGYIDYSQLRRRYHIHDRVIVLFTGDDPPKWYKGTIRNGVPQHPWYYVVFDDGDKKWIEYKNNNIRNFGREGLVPGQGVRNKATDFYGIILETASNRGMIKVKVIRPDNSHFIQYWTKSQTEILPGRGGGTQRKTKKRRRKSRRKKRTKKRKRRKKKRKTRR